MGRSIPPTRHVDKRGEPFVIREATAADATSILDAARATLVDAPNTMISLVEEFVYTLPQERTLLEQYRKSDTDAFFIATRRRMRRGGIIGILNGRVKARRRLQHNWSLGVTVRQEERGLGVGRALMERAVHYVGGHPALSKISLTVLADNEPAITLYRSLGFVEEGRRVREVCFTDQDGRYVDDIMMYRWLGDEPT